MSETHRVLLLVFSPRFLAVTQCLARAPNFRISILVGNNEKIAARFSRHIQSVTSLPSSKEDSVLIDAIIQEARQVRASLLLPVDEKAIGLVIRNKEQLSAEIPLPPLPHVEAMNLVMDKWSMAVFMMEKGIPTPATIQLSSWEQVRAEIARLTFPVLVKPTVGESGRGIRYFPELTQLQEFLSSDAARSEKYIIQEFIAGHAVDCSVLCRNGEILAYTIQQPLDAKVDRFEYSKCIKFIEDGEAFHTTKELVASLKWSGVAHVDMQFDKTKAKLMVLELNPRFWGTVRGSHAVGVNFPHLACLCALNREFGILPPYNFESFYDKWEALQHWLRMGSGARSEALPLKNTMWAYILKDPLPFVISGGMNSVRKIVKIFPTLGHSRNR